MFAPFWMDKQLHYRLVPAISRISEQRPSTSVRSAGPANIQGIGEVEISVQRPLYGARKITLKQAYYSSGFPTSLVSLKAANKAGILWDQTISALVQNGQIWGEIQDLFEQYVLEYNPIDQKEVALVSGKYTKSTEPKPAEIVHLQTIHWRFAHAGIETLKNIPISTQGINISNTTDT